MFLGLNKGWGKRIFRLEMKELDLHSQLRFELPLAPTKLASDRYFRCLAWFPLDGLVGRTLPQVEYGGSYMVTLVFENKFDWLPVRLTLGLCLT